ncbi:hypothetical protein BU17DRAFT_93029 [Hysterangium stoloniferum]|nr:hypothetical protein BU17DRAFT_93029 [Hysterangium stoloniferum]
MLWRAGSGHRHILQTLSCRPPFCLSLRWLSSDTKNSRGPTSASKIFAVEPQAQAEKFWTSSIYEKLVPILPKWEAKYVASFRPLLTQATSKETILSTLQTIWPDSRVFSTSRTACVYAQGLVKQGLGERAIDLLQIAHCIGLKLRHNEYEQVVYQLAMREEWDLLVASTTIAHNSSGYWSGRLLDWKIRGCIKTQDFSFLNIALDEFDRIQRMPSQRTFHLLVEGHLLNSNVQLAREVLQKMQAAGFQMSKYTFSVVLSAYSTLGNNKAVEKQAFRTLSGYAGVSDTMVLNGLIQAKVDALDIEGALRLLRLFDLSKMDVDTTCPPAITGASKQIDKNHNVGTPSIRPNDETFNVLLMLLARSSGELPQVLIIYRLMRSMKAQPDANTAAALILAYAQSGHQDIAVSLVYRMCREHKPNINKVQFRRLGGTVNVGRILRRNVYGLLSILPTIKVFNVLLRIILPTKHLPGLRLFLRILKQLDITPNADTTQIILTYLRDTHHMRPHTLVRVLKILTGFPAYSGSFTIQHLNTIIASYIRRETNIIRSHSWNAAVQRVRFRHRSRFSIERMSSKVAPRLDPTAGIALDSFPSKRVNRILEGFLQSLLGRDVRSTRVTFALRIRRDAVVKLDMEQARYIFDVMVSRGIRPNKYHYSALVEGYAALGNMEDAREMMKRSAAEGIRPNLHMYTIIIRGYAMLGNPDAAKATFREMLNAGVKPDIAVVDVLVGAYWFVKAHKAARTLLLDIWPLVAPFPPELDGAPLKVLLHHLRRLRGKPSFKTVPPLESPEEIKRRQQLRRSVRLTLKEASRLRSIADSISWAKTDISWDYMLQTDTSNTEKSD